MTSVAHVFRWDLDKTYLRSEFDTVRDLVRSALERAEAKRAVPGASALLRELKRGDGARVCFISGSPRQMRRVLERKLQLDGVQCDEFILKPNLHNFLRGRFRALRDQVGYKLPVLLGGRVGSLPAARETCFGDDAEADAFVYSLYADIVARRVDGDLLARILERARFYRDDAERTLSLASQVGHGEVVDRIFIHLDGCSPTIRFERYGRRLVPIYNYFQAALVLAEDGLFQPDAVLRIVADMVERFDYSLDALGNSADDLLRRGRLAMETVERLTDHAAESPGGMTLAALLARRRSSSRPITLATVRLPIDYLAAFDEDVPSRRRAAIDRA